MRSSGTFPTLAAPDSRRDTILAPESSIEGSLGFISDRVGDPRNGVRRLPKQSTSLYQPLLREIAHGRFANDPCESLRKRRAGEAALHCKVVCGPAPCYLTSSCVRADREPVSEQIDKWLIGDWQNNALVALAADAMRQTRLLVNNPRVLELQDAVAIYRQAW